MTLEFASPRFAGDPLLHAILNDPDSGTVKLGPGSPSASVMLLQKALFDLGWPQRADPPISIESQFVIGVYGPVTTQSVVSYKTKYGIHFPPDDPTGFIDGFAGPRTMRALDAHCVLFDQCDSALQIKADEIEQALGNQHDPPTTAILDTNGATRMRTGGGVSSLGSGLWFKVGIGAFHVAHPFWPVYVEKGSESGPLGFPVTDAVTSDGRTIQEFEGGQMLVENAEVSILLADPRPIEIEDPSF